MTSQSCTTSRRGRSGQTLVEFALILMLLLVLLFGLMEFARAWQYSNALTNGVRDGVRYASTLTNMSSNDVRVKDYTFAQITTAVPRGDMTTDDIVVTLNNNTTVTVQASYNLDIITWRLFGFLSETDTESWTLDRSSTMRKR